MFARSTVRQGFKFAKSTRSMSSGHSAEEIRGEILRWQKFTAGMIVLSTVVGIYNYVNHDHAHGVRTDMAYMKIRNKPYPWECSDCNIFDRDCWKVCRGETVESHEEEAHH